jgi:hypothetical protein
MPKREDKPTLTVIDAGSPEVPAPPRKLGEHGTALWLKTQSEYQIEDAGGVELLLQACSALDLAETPARKVEEDGAIVYTRSGAPKTHPGIKDQIAARALCVRCLEKLGITSENIKPARGGQPRVTQWSGSCRARGAFRSDAMRGRRSSRRARSRCTRK